MHSLGVGGIRVWGLWFYQMYWSVYCDFLGVLTWHRLPRGIVLLGMLGALGKPDGRIETISWVLLGFQQASFLYCTYDFGLTTCPRSDVPWWNFSRFDTWWGGHFGDDFRSTGKEGAFLPTSPMLLKSPFAGLAFPNEPTGPTDLINHREWYQWFAWGDFSPTSGPVAGDMPDDLDLGYSPAFLAATDFIKDGTVSTRKTPNSGIFRTVTWHM